MGKRKTGDNSTQDFAAYEIARKGPSIESGHGDAQKVFNVKPLAYELAYANQRKPWAKRWLRERGLRA